MNLSLRQIRYIQSVSDTGSIQSASRALRISASSILSAIELAEFELGARIFHRKRAAGITLTPEGAKFLAAAGQLLASARDFERQVGILQDTVAPILRIGCFEPFGAIFMAEALRLLPQSERVQEISLFEGDQPQLLEWLNRGMVDVVVTYDLGLSFGPGSLKLCRVPPHALVHQDDPLAQRAAISLKELAEKPIVLLDLPPTANYFLSLFDIVGVKPRVSFRSRSYETVRSAVAAGFGAAVLNMCPVGETSPDSPLLRRIPLSDDLPAPVLLIADLYGDLKPKSVSLLIESFVNLFTRDYRESFAVVTPDKRQTLFDM
ncbi:MAG: LysR family transcriptional regulator [Roseinatronobacter sp.]